HFIDYLSPRWLDMLHHTLQAAEKADMGVDIAMASGWPFGGPWVEKRDACKYITYQSYSLKRGEKLEQSIRFKQTPILTVVGGQLAIHNIKNPVYKNPNLHTLGMEQVRFGEEIPLVLLMAYSDRGEIVDLTEKVNSHGQLNWI